VQIVALWRAAVAQGKLHARLLKTDACALRKTPRIDRLILDAARSDRIGCLRALVGETNEFLRLVLAPRLFGDVPIQTGVGAQPLSEIFRVGHGSGPQLHLIIRARDPSMPP
jgi:hypothetical protein